MDDYIDRKAVYKATCKGCTKKGDEVGTCYADELCEELHSAFVGAPTADVEAVRHGHWTIEVEKHQDSVSGEIDEEFYLKCSECGREVWGIDHMTVLQGTDEEIFGDYPYCHCGAKMDGGTNK